MLESINRKGGPEKVILSRGGVAKIEAYDSWGRPPEAAGVECRCRHPKSKEPDMTEE